jgi:signal transduction histidine kinase/ActR/RegA family two-component response regulator
VPLGCGIAGRVARDGKPVLVQDARATPRATRANDPDLASSFLSAPIAMSVPIASHARIVGVLNVTNPRDGRALTPEDLDWAQAMGTQIGVALESMRRLAEVRRAYDSLREAQDQLVASERLKAVGQMAAGVAHDFNNWLAVILGRTETCLLRLDSAAEIDRSSLRTDLEAITRTAIQGADAVRRVQDFTRPRSDAPQDRVLLSRVVREAIEMTRPKWRGEVGSRGKSIEIDTSIGDTPAVLGSAHELSQVLSNLIFNAVEAMPDGGRLSFRTGIDGGRVFAEVADTGQGMDEGTRARLFEPFFTTKATGNGLGMSIVQGIVHAHGGTIDVQSAPGAGTRFRLAFPAAQVDACTTLPDAEPAVDARRARILLVDDDQAVRETLRDILEAIGHEVVAVSSGPQATRACDTGRFDVVITDFNMPGMSGLEVAAELRRRDGGLPVILLTGWAASPEADLLAEAGIEMTLTKPCSVDTLRKAVAAVVQRVATGRA